MWKAWLGKLPGWVQFGLAFITFCSAYEYGRVLNLPPLPLHMWRQTDCLSITANFHSGAATIMEPTMHARLGDQGLTGRSAGEFPLLYWFVGQIWKLSGQSELAYRLVGLLLHFFGSLALYLMLKRVLNSHFWGMCISLLLFTSPVLIYYGISFLTDVPAFDMVLIGWYFVARFALEKRPRWWLIGMGFFSLGMLLKITAGMSFFALLAACLAVLAIPSARKWRSSVPGFVLLTSGAAAALLPVVGWYLHAEGYNRIHQGRYTFNGLWPIWEMSSVEVDEALSFARELLFHQLFDNSIWSLVLIAGLVLVVNVRTVPMPFGVGLLTLLLGTITYTLCWFHAVNGHDYYFINPLVFPLAILIVWLVWLKRDHSDIFHSRWLRTAFTLVLCYNVVYAANNFGLRTNPFAEDSFFEEHWGIQYAREESFFQGQRYRSDAALMGLPDSLLPADAVVCVPEDPTISASLYALDRPGFTGYGKPKLDPSLMELWRSLGATHLVLFDRSMAEEAGLLAYLAKPHAEYNGAKIFDLTVLPRECTTHWLTTDDGLSEALSVSQDGTRLAGREWKLEDTWRPLRISGLPLADEALLSEVLVTGEVNWFSGRPGRSVLLVVQEDAAGNATYQGVPLSEGPFTFLIRTIPNRDREFKMLQIENNGGGVSVVRLDHLVVRNYKGLE